VAKTARKAAPAARSAVTPDLSYIHAALRPFARPVADLILDPKNARLHDDRNLQSIEDSLDAHGQVIPIVVDSNDVVRAGNGRLLVFRRKGWTHIAAVPFQGNEAESVAFALRDNRTSELAKWDFEQLTQSLRELAASGLALPKVGWNEAEFGPLLQATFTPPAVGALENKPSRGTGDKRVESELAVICDTPDQIKVIRQALTTLRATEGDERISDGRGLELICADFLAGADRDAQ
jgi:ParB-like nuclease family protein